MKKILQKKLDSIELFGGIGTPYQALKNINIKADSIKYIEILNYAGYAYQKLHSNEILKNKTSPESVVGYKFKADLLIHGSPCQDFSQAGKNDISKGRSILYKETLRIIEEMAIKPKYVLWENVKGVTNKRNFPHFQDYLNTMEKLGYVNHWKILNSKDFGIPQSRNRVFVVSIRKDLNQEFNFDKLDFKEHSPLINFLEKNVDKSYYITQKSMIKAIQSGKIKIVDNICETITTKQFRWNNAGVVKIQLHPKPFNSTDFIHNINTSTMHTIDTNSANNRIAEPILQKPIEGVPIFIIDGKPYHLRVLTERECWRLMGWKDEDIDKVTDIPKTVLYQLAGNAIVVQVLEAIFKELLKEWL